MVTEYLERSGLDEPLVELGFDLVGYGCTTCIGNSGPLPEAISEAIEESNLVVCSVLSGNRNFEGRIHPEVKMNYLASPPLCVAYALAGRMDLDIVNDPIGQGSDGEDVYLRDIWPSQEEVNAAVESAVESEMFRNSYGDTLFEGDDNWKEIDIPEGDRYEWQDDSTYVRRAPYFEGMSQDPPEGFEQVEDARILCLLGDSVTTDHISPAGAFKEDTPAGEYLREHGVERKDFNSYGSRRGNHEVMMRGTFANVRLRNLLAPGTEGGFTLHLPDEEEMTIFDAAMKYADEGVPLGVLAGKEYGSGSSRDWAAKGPRLLGVRFVIAESYERIHRSNLVGMGILPLQFPDGESVESLGLTGKETYTLAPLEDGAKTLKVAADDTKFEARVRIDTPNEWQYYRHGGILHFRAAADAAGRELTLRHHDGCFACGTGPGLGLELDLRDDGSVAGAFTPSVDVQGPPGMAHGGVVATALDEAMSLCVHQQTLAFTAHFEMDLHGPAPLDAPVELEARIDRRDGRKIWASAEALGESGVVATGSALFVEVVR